MPDKPKVGFYWCASCGGCEEAIVDLAEDILGVLDAVDIVFWPCAMDFKKSDVVALPDGSIAATFLNGAIRSSEQEEMARLIRRKSRRLFAFGSCAHLGGIPSLANLFSREQLLRYIYEDAPTLVNERKNRPQLEYEDEGHTLSLPELRHVVRSLDQVVAVDYYLPGCPPTPKLAKAALTALLEGQLPPPGAVLAPDVALCNECPRKETKPTTLAFTEFVRPQQKLLDPKLCFLAQGLVCFGPATRSGCEAVCPQGGMPCSGCFGPTSRVKDQGAKMLSSLCSNISSKEVSEINRALAGIPDSVGTLYRYGLAKCLLRRKVNLPGTGKD
jgi:F420-non-reducing hydrogenase small subunit